MRNRVFIFLGLYLFIIFILILSRTAFMFVNMHTYPEVGMSYIADILYHGMPLDLSVAGYLCILPGLLLLVSIWIKPQYIYPILNIYFAIVIALLIVISITDIIIYPYWGFHFDSSIFLYLQKPKEALASGSILLLLLGIAITVVVVFLLYKLFNLIFKQWMLSLGVPKSTWISCAILLLLTGALFLPIRGGVTVSTMNIGKAYFSDISFLNHAAVNPHFNLLYSMSKSEDFASQYQFLEKEEAQSIMSELSNEPRVDSMGMMLSTSKPNVILFLLESFSANVANDSLIAPNLHQLAKEGISFTNFYANSFRTDRGLVSILSGYPAHPTVAIMKYPQKTQTLPSIPKKLKEAGYESSFYYGGDADFANMRSYLLGSCGFSKLVSDSDFPISERLTKWGVADNLLFERVYNDVIAKPADKPFMTTILSLSSHEPFDVPTKKFEEPFLNSVAYTDSCIGVFVNKLRATPQWDNTLIVFVADHCMQGYPTGIDNHSAQRFHIPLIWAGGAIKEAHVTDDFGSQNDLASTLLSQLEIPHNDFTFSKNMFNPEISKFAFYAYSNGFSMQNKEGKITYDNDQKKMIEQVGDSSLEKKAKAFFQNMYIDLGSR